MADFLMSFIFMMIGGVYFWLIKYDFEGTVICFFLAGVFALWSIRHELFFRNRRTEAMVVALTEEARRQAGDSNAS